MSLLVLLDTGPLGVLTNPSGSLENQRCTRWLRALSAGEHQIIVPEVADYEVRRELLRADKVAGLRRLDTIKTEAIYLPITTETMLLAAQFWADVRRRGLPTADRHALDGDVILAAQATLLASPADQVVIATTNAAHLARFVDARAWQDIPPP